MIFGYLLLVPALFDINMFVSSLQHVLLSPGPSGSWWHPVFHESENHPFPFCSTEHQFYLQYHDISSDLLGHSPVRLSNILRFARNSLW